MSRISLSPTIRPITGFSIGDDAIHFFVEGTPTPKARARVVSGHAYTPARTKAWEERVAWGARTAMRGRPPLTGPIDLTVSFFGARANSDLDNLVKACSDALNGICFVDDKQIDMVLATRARSMPDLKGVEIIVRELS